MSTAKEKTKACCSKENEALKAHLEHCDSPVKTEEEKHHCYRHAAWHSGRRAKRCATAS
jgi:hypothetical protein